MIELIPPRLELSELCVYFPKEVDFKSTKFICVYVETACKQKKWNFDINKHKNNEQTVQIYVQLHLLFRAFVFPLLSICTSSLRRDNKQTTLEVKRSTSLYTNLF